MTLREQYTAGLLKMGAVKQQSKSTKFDVYLITTSALYGINPLESNEPRYVFVSRRGPALRLGRTPKVTDMTMSVHEKAKARIISFCS